MDDDSKLVIDEDLCRICRSTEGGQLDIFGLSGAERNIPVKIRECLPIKVSEKDGLPKTICTDCADKLEDFYNFRHLSRKIDSTFAEMLHSDPNKSDSDCSNSKMSDTYKDKGENSSGQLTIDIQTSSSPKKTQAKLGDPQPEDYVLMKEETITVDNTAKNSNIMADYLIEFNNNNKEKSDSEIQDADILNAMRKRREVLPPMWDVFERISHEEKPADPKACKGKQGQPQQQQQQQQSQQVQSPQNTRTVLKGKFSVIHRRYIVAKGAFPCSLCGRCFLFNQGRPREGIPYADADIVQCDQDSNTDSPNSDGLFPCPQCGKLFPRRTSLKRHQQIHLDGKKYVCKLCGKAFNRNEHLTRHMLSHTGGRPFQCDLCAKVFTRKEHLVRHRQSHEYSGTSVKEEVPDESSGPGYGFSDFAEATESKPFVCDICHSAYARREHMTKHKKVAHGIDADPESEPKPYCCNHCFKTFTRKEHLTRHKKIHIREAFSGNYEIADGVAPSLLISGPTGGKPAKDKPTTKKDVLIPLTVNCNISKLSNVTITPQVRGSREGGKSAVVAKPQVSIVKPMTNVTPLSMNRDTVTLEISGGSDGSEYKSSVGESLMNSILKNGKYGEISIVDVKSERPKPDVSVTINRTKEVYPDALMECSIEEGGDSGPEYETNYYDNKMLTEEEKAQLEGFLAETSFGGGDFLAGSYDTDSPVRSRHRDHMDEYEEKDSIDIDDLKKMPRCRICSKAFSKKNHLNRHLKRYHNLTKEQVNSGKYEVYENGGDGGSGGGGGGGADMDDAEGDEFYDEDGNPILKRPKGTFPCNVCKKTFTRKYHMYRHRKTQHGINFPNKGNPEDESSSSSTTLKCSTCSTAFASSEEYQKHECGGAADDEEDVVEEEKRSVEPRRKPKNSFKCAICKNTFETHDGFKDHVCKKGHRCDTCGETFEKSKHLAKHMATHADNREDDSST